MKRVLRTIAVIGGIVGVVWAMREKLISIPSAREQEPPEFRVPQSNGKPVDGA